MAMTAKKPQSSIYDYPEHLNPFHEDDNHSKLRFWTMGRKRGRSSSFSFSSLKDFRNTLTLRSFRKKDRSTLGAPMSCISAQNSPVEYRKSFHVNSTVSPEMSRNKSTSQPQFDVLCTPLPRSRFHERTSHLNTATPEVETPTNKSDRVSLSNPTSHRDSQAYPLPGLTEKRSDMGSSSSLQSNPFGETAHSPIRASARKKRRAPLPPISSNVTPLSPVPNITITDTSVVQDTDDTSISVRKKLFEETVTENDEIDIEDPSFKMELKIIEDDEDNIQIKDAKLNETNTSDQHIAKINTELNETNTSDQHVAKINTELNETNTSDQHIAKIDEELEIVKKLIIETRIETIHVIDDNESKINKEIPEDNKKGDINGIIEEKNNDTTDVLENSDDLFKKVDIVTYKKQQSHENHSDVYENKSEISAEVQTVVLDNNNLTENKVEHKTNTNDWEMSEFSEFDKVIQHIENTAIAFIDEDDVKPEESKGNRVSQLKFQFEKVNIKDDDAYEIKTNSPNPIPKPRRAKLFSKSISSDSSKAATPSSPDS